MRTRSDKQPPPPVTSGKPYFKYLCEAIADSWPDAVDDSAAWQEWGWAPRFGRAEMVDDMLENLRHGLGAE